MMNTKMSPESKQKVTQSTVQIAMRRDLREEDGIEFKEKSSRNFWQTCKKFTFCRRQRRKSGAFYATILTIFELT